MDKIKINATSATIGKIKVKRDFDKTWLTLFPSMTVEGKARPTYAMVATDELKLTVANPELIRKLKDAAELGEVGKATNGRPFIKGKHPLNLRGVTIEGKFIRSVESAEVAKLTPVVDAELDAEPAAYIAENTKKETK